MTLTSVPCACGNWGSLTPVWWEVNCAQLGTRLSFCTLIGHKSHACVLWSGHDPA